MKFKYGKVAVIMRTKNRNIFLKRAIESVIKQTYKQWILVIVNDGGDIKAVESLLNNYSEYKEKIYLINNKESLGMECSSNKGIKSVDSDYIVIHDDDDTWKDEFLNKTVTYLENNIECNGVITHSNKVIEKVEGEIISIKKIKPFNNYLKETIDLYELCLKNLFSPISFVYKRKIFDEIGYYDESLPVLGDWEFNLRFIKLYDIHVIEEPLANYHQRPQIKKGIYSNSIVGGKKTHLYYETFIKNKLLRMDINSGKLGIGTIINLSRGYKNSGLIRIIKNKLNL